MAEFFLELFSEEIPARMQAAAAQQLGRLVGGCFQQIIPAGRQITLFWGPRRIALSADVEVATAAIGISARGPRIGAPQQAIDGFLKKNGATAADLRQNGGYFEIEIVTPPRRARDIIVEQLPDILRRFPWPKSMRWGGTSAFTWVRPLRRIVCLLDGAVVPFDLRDGSDDGHGLAASDITEGHRFLSPGEIHVTSCADWQAKLRDAHVIVDATERRALIDAGLREQAAIRGLALVEDSGLLDEVTGLVEWPVPLVGAIGDEYMDLPAEVMQVSMRVNQRYFALRDAFGRPAPFFAFAANVEATDGGATIIAGNERVLRARFSDARHFWDLDRARSLESRVAALDGITFHARLGSQGERVSRIRALAKLIAPLVGADPKHADEAANLAKADLTTGMVGEFPELQGVIGGYYAAHDGKEPCVAEAIRDHYLPRGPGDGVPVHPVGVAVALADKLDTLAGFFCINEKPTGSGDPYALRRAALGVIRIIREKSLRLGLFQQIEAAMVAHLKRQLKNTADEDTLQELLSFILERLRVQLRAEGARHDVLNAVLGAGSDDDVVRILTRTDAVAAFLASEDGVNLLAAYRRAANILRIEDKKDGPHVGAIETSLLEAEEEQQLAAKLAQAAPAVATAVAAERYGDAMQALAELRTPIDTFFTTIQVNADRPELRRNRLRLLAAIRAAMDLAADFARIEG